MGNNCALHLDYFGTSRFVTYSSHTLKENFIISVGRLLRFQYTAIVLLKRITRKNNYGTKVKV